VRRIDYNFGGFSTIKYYKTDYCRYIWSGVYHQIKKCKLMMARRAEYLPSDKEKSEFVMARRAGNLPSDKEKQVCDGSPGGKFTIR
jgi:hypothetical protein